MDEWGCPACKKCHCRCHLFCDYHYDPTDEWNWDQCHKDGFHEVGLLHRFAHRLWGTQDTLQQGGLCWLGSTMRTGQLHREWHGDRGRFKLILQGYHLTGVLLLSVGARITDI